MEFTTTDIFKGILSGMWEVKELYLVLFGVALLAILLRIGLDLMSRRSKIKWLLGKKKVEELQKLTPTQFEEYIVELFRSLGYKTKVTGGRGDGGVDVEAEMDGVMKGTPFLRQVF